MKVLYDGVEIGRVMCGGKSFNEYEVLEAAGWSIEKLNEYAGGVADLDLLTIEG